MPTVVGMDEARDARLARRQRGLVPHATVGVDHLGCDRSNRPYQAGRPDHRELPNGVDAVQPGVVGAHLNWAKQAAGESINSLTSETLTDLGAGATFYSCLVEVEKA